MKHWIRLLTAVIGGAVIATLLAVAPASAATSPGLVWGPGFPAKSYTFHQPHNGSPGWAYVSPNGLQRFSIQSDGNLVLYKKFYNGVRVAWYPYWSSRTNGRGYYFHLQNDGNLVESGATNRPIWASNHHPGRYNYYLTIQNDGNLVEYYSHGDPRRTPRSVAWATGRIVTSSPRVCAAGSLSPSSTLALRFPAQGGSQLSVTVANPFVTGVAVTVSRWYNGHELLPIAAVVPPYSSHTFSRSWYVGDNLPENVEMHVRVQSNSLVAAGAKAYGHCWYLP